MVVVSVDQLAYDHLERFQKNFSAEGVFRLMQSDGAWFANAHHRHAFTYTAPGHAAQLTGCYASENGIVENDWFDRVANKKVYCVTDPTVKLIGTTLEDPPASPRNLFADTVGDRLKVASNRRSKVFGVAIKDRASILLAGHLADAAYWMSNDGKWITSDYYRPDLPGYLRQWNESDRLKSYGGAKWDRLLPAEKYLHGPTEDNFGERPYAGASPGFPHVLTQASDPNFVKQVAGSPFGNDLALEAALAVLENEQLGDDEHPDLLCINLSSNDYVGHAFGPQSLEVEDMTYRTDLQLGAFLKAVAAKVANRPWLLAITADHGVGPVPEVAIRQGFAGARDPFGKAEKNGDIPGLTQPLEAYLRKALDVSKNVATPLVQASTDNEIFFTREHPELEGKKFVLAQELARDFLLQQPAVAAAFTRASLLAGGGTLPLDQKLRRAFNPKRSGDVLYVMQPYHIHGQTAAATHGSPWEYDTHVPLMLAWFGKGESPIKAGVYHDDVSPAQIAPTLARLLGITPPAMCVETELAEALK